MWNASTFQHESQLNLYFNWLFILIFNIHIQSDEYASCPKIATYSRCYLLGNNIQLSEEWLRIIDSQEFVKC